jgi:hypothetical protein
MPDIVGPVDPTQPIDVNISGLTPDVFAYRLWWRDTASPTWAVIGQGSTGDQQPDYYQQSFAKGAQLYYWIAVGGNANDDYDAIITLSQSGKALPSGLVHITGKTNAKGVDVQQDWLNFV